MKKTLIALTFCIAAVGLAVDAGALSTAAIGRAQASAPAPGVASSLPVEWDRPQAPFDERVMTPVETAGASRGD